MVRRGFSLIEVMMALAVTLLGTLAYLASMPIGWGLASGSDMRTLGAEILHRELEQTEVLILNPCNQINVNGPLPNKTAYAAGQPGQAALTPNAGDFSFTVAKSVVQSGSGWVITVQVLWPGTSTGITESRYVTRQDDYADNLNCAVTHANCSFVTNSCS